jgi:TonB-linked SusC/RagA family outer membrane protein
MKKNCFCGGAARGSNRRITKTLLVMKLTFVLLITCFLSVSATGLSQNITFSGKNVPLTSVFSSVEKQSNVVFVYTDQIMKLSKPVTIQATNAPLTQFLSDVFKNQPLTFEISGKNIFVSRRNETALPSVPKGATDLLNDTLSVRGKIMNEDGEPLAGANIVVKGTVKGTTADAKGEFEIKELDENSILSISSVGYTLKNVPVKSKGSYSIILIKSESKLDEVQVIAYGTTTQRYSTSSVNQVTYKDIEKQPVANPLAALQGRVSGLLITNTTGLPGGNVAVQIRGRNSIAAGNDPLYIVDGVAFNSTPLNSSLPNAAGQASPFNSINPEDIESIVILKDADATSIYGSRAANGVIMITTKFGKAGPTRFTANVYSGVGKVAGRADMLDLHQYLQARRRSLAMDNVPAMLLPFYAPDIVTWDTTKSTDWQKFLTGGSAPITNVEASVSGGSGNTRFLISGNYHKEGTVYPDNDLGYRRGGMHINIDNTSLNGKFRIGASASYTADNSKLIQRDLSTMYAMPPNFPLYDSTGKLYFGYIDNPVALLKQTSTGKTDNLIASTQLSYRIIPDLLFRTNLGYTKISRSDVAIYPKSSLNPLSGTTNSYAQFNNASGSTWLIEPQLDYIKQVKDNRLEALAGLTYQGRLNESNYVQGIDYVNENLLQTISGAGSINAKSATHIEYKFASLFARLNYSLKSKYLANLSFRRDVSSRFGPGKRAGNFGALGAAWLFSKEELIKNALPFLSFGKLKGSYGIVGNDQIADYGYLSTYTSNNTNNAIYQGVATLTPSRIANANYSWENTRKLDVSLNLGFLKDRILLDAGWFLSRSDNQLVQYPLPSQTGFIGYQANLPALVQNKGWEFELSVTPLKTKDYSWNIDLNLTLPQNKLVKFHNIANTAYASIYEVGKPLDLLKGFSYRGVDPGTGQALYLDVNKDGIISNYVDYVTIGKRSPDAYGGFNNTFTYKRWEVDIFFQFVKQKAFGASKGYSWFFNNFTADAVDAWQKPGQNASVPRVIADFASPMFNPNGAYYATSSATFNDASYLRLKNVYISYKLAPSWVRKIKAQSCKLYMQGQNLLTFTKYKGIDPETQGVPNPITFATDGSTLPPLRVFTGGIQITF